MERAEYMRLKGELVTVSEALTATRGEKRKTLDALQSWVNKLHSDKLTPDTATQGRDLIDKLLTLQQQETAQDAQEAQYKRALQGVALPPA